MADPKEQPFFDLPPLPAPPPGKGSKEKIREKTGSQDKPSNEGKESKSKEKIGSKEIATLPTKPAPNLGIFKALIAVTWLLFLACVAGLIYVIVQYKIDRDELKAGKDTEGS